MAVMYYQVFLRDPESVLRGEEVIVGPTDIYEEISAYRAKRAFWKDYYFPFIKWRYLEHFFGVHILREEEEC